MTGTEPRKPDPCDPTEEQIAVARRRLDEHAGRHPDGIEFFVLGWIEGYLGGIDTLATAEDVVRRSRAMLAAYKARRDGSVES